MGGGGGVIVPRFANNKHGDDCKHDFHSADFQDFTGNFTYPDYHRMETTVACDLKTYEDGNLWVF